MKNPTSIRATVLAKYHFSIFVNVLLERRRSLIGLFFLFLLGNPCDLFSQCNALHFDGENDYVQANSPISGNTDFTIEMWFRSDNNNAGGVCDNNSLADFRWLVGWDNNNFGLGECHGNLGVIFKSSCPGSTGLCSSLPTIQIQDSLWHHVALTKNAVSIRILVDGVLLTSFGSGNYDLSGTYRLGSSGSGTVGKTWQGAIDEVRIWNVVRSDAQIQAARNCQLAWNEPGLVTLFRANIGFPEGPNAGLSNLNDLSPTHQNGALVNFALDGPTSNWVGGPDEICDVYCAPPAGEITQIAPIGEVFWATGEPKKFIWTKAAGYAGLYRLKIKKLAADEEAPLNLPDTGLFYDNAAIPDTSFILPGSVPDFDTLARYVWQIETVGTAGGVRRFGTPVIIIVLQGGLNLTLSPFPTTQLCPGDCFNVTASFSPSGFFSFNKLRIYSDCIADILVTIPPSIGFGTLPTGFCNTRPLPIPGALIGMPHYNYFTSPKTFQICVKKGRATPVTLSFYFYRSNACLANPFGCPHDIETRTITVANVPNYSNLTLEIEHPVTQNNLTEICSGDAIHVCLRDAAGNVPPPGAPAPVITWECSTTGSTGPFNPVTYTNFSPTQFCFSVPKNVVTSTNCAIPSHGFEDKVFRAKLVVIDPMTGKICTYYSSTYPLRICCPVPKPTVVLNVQPPGALNGTLCEGDAVVIDVSLANLPGWFPPAAGSVVTVDWCLNGVPIPAVAGMTQFSYPITVGTANICFSVKIKNCACPLVTAETCIKVDPLPKCGTIIGCDPVDLTLIATSPMLCYEICPFHDAAVCIDQPFTDCIPHWQFSFDNITWLPISQQLGISNNTQQTNTLPCDDIGSPYQWPTGQQCIYYRIACYPLSYPAPSGCEPCYSNTIKICLKPSPAIPNVVISAPNPICKGNSATLTVTNPQAGITYTWYCNGIVVQQGPLSTYAATQQAWYWVEADNGCEVVESNHVFLKVCMVTAVISCPLFPNPCAKLGDPIYLSACASTSTCGGPLTYMWTLNPPSPLPIITNGCDLQHIPPATGTTYTVKVTDPFGCMDTASITVIPCQ